jgi:ATP-dependent Lhr-like helicase
VGELLPRPILSEVTGDALSFHAEVSEWFEGTFDQPTPVQLAGWPVLAAAGSALLLAPTGSGKTLAAFLAAIDRVMFRPDPGPKERLSIIYVSPLKALAVDVERNLRAPLAGIAAVCARRGTAHRVPEIAIRSGDTSARERSRFLRAAPDILITTPESLYLLLTSRAREMLRHVETVIIDEIHSVVGSKRGAHLALSLERLEALRLASRPLQRIGLSATQRPLEEVARMLGGGELAADVWRPRPVQIIDAGAKKQLDIRVEVPVEDMTRVEEGEPTIGESNRHSIWTAIHPRLVELIREHRSTMIFVNSRRLAERLAASINEIAGEELALAHHGSVAAPRRAYIEDRLKRGDLPAIVATSSLELGIDMGAVDLVVQMESPPSVASGLQRIGRSGHTISAKSKGIVLPKYRGDLLGCAAAASAMNDAAVEATLYPRNPLDVLAQQIVATVAMDSLHVDTLYDLVRRAAPFAELPRAAFDGVLDMLSGRYPSDDFAELRPRVVWNRVAGTLRAHEGALRLAVINAGTIPDRGLYGVFLAGSDKPVRVGELDEEMVFESKAGEVFLLGASSWRIEDISHDRVLVSPAHGEPGKMPFWQGDRPGRPYEFGERIGRLAREIAALPRARALDKLEREHRLDARAAENLVAYVREQVDATGEVPSDTAVIVERFMDELGDWRVCLLSPFGARVHAPWAMAALARARSRGLSEIEAVWSDDGIVFRFPETEEAPDADLLVPSPEELHSAVTAALAQTSLFAARFRENAGRALLLPKRLPGRRTPLWAQRRRASDLLAVASRYPSFPIVLETFRECLRDTFDLPALTELLRRIEQRRVRLIAVDTTVPSPFAASLLFSYVANFIYEGDAPLAERRAQALTLDHARLRELLGEAELRELLDAEQIEAVHRKLQRLEPPTVRSPDSLHDLLVSLGPLSEAELTARTLPNVSLQTFTDELLRERRAFRCKIAGVLHVAAAEDAGKLRDGLGVAPPPGLPDAFTEPAAAPLESLLGRFSRTRGPFRALEAASRFGLGIAVVEDTLRRLQARGRVVEGEFLPGGRGAEWCDAEVLRSIKRRSLAKLRHEVEPVEPSVLASFLSEWHGLHRPRGGEEGLLAVIEQLQGAPLVASTLEDEILPARVRAYSPAMLDALCATGEVIWRGLEPLGPSDGRVALYLADDYSRIAPAPTVASVPLAQEVRALLELRGASFFSDIVARTGAFAGDVLKALWDLVWAGEVTNDTLAPLRSLVRPAAHRADRPGRARATRARRIGPPGSEGRWSLLPATESDAASGTTRAAALAQTLLERHGVLTREAVHAESVPGGFSSVYAVLKAMEESGRARRGYFVAGLGATQFAALGADERLRALRDESQTPPRTWVLAATDPAQPYGAALPWPQVEPRPTRSAGALVVLRGGNLLGYLARGGGSLRTFLPRVEERETAQAAQALAQALADLVDGTRRRAVLLSSVDGKASADEPLAHALSSAGFVATSRGLMKRGASRVTKLAAG